MISIITPTHKKSVFWEATVLSVLSQTSANWEWIVLDNAKEPYFKKLLDMLLEQYPEYKKLKKKIKIYEETFPEVCIGKLKNRCVELTDCKDDDFILLLDHDDLLMPSCVADIEKTQKKIGKEIDYITSDCPIVSYWQNRLVPESLYETWTEPIPVEDLKVGNWTFSFYNMRSSKRIDKIPIGDHVTYISEHPRIIKKRIIKTDTCKFYEGLHYSEDTMQRVVLTLFHNGVYIPKQEIICIHNRPDPNDDSFIDSGTYLQFHDGINEFTEWYQKLNNFYIVYRSLFPDKKVIEIPHFNPDEE